jgi:DNA-binding transcriptional LysR family regulator
MKLINADLRQLRAFAIVAEELNFIRASERLNISQPALSHTIRNLELELGFALFDRDTRHVTITEKGRQLLDDVRIVLNSFEALSNKARALARNLVGTLNVGYLIGAAVDLVPTIIRTFREEYPETNLVLKEYDFASPEAGIDGEVDVAILRPPIKTTAVKFTTLMEEPIVACLPASHRLARHESISIQDILDEPIIAAPGKGVWRDYWIASAYRNGKPANVVHEAPTFESELQAVAAGRGISITARAANDFYAKRGLAFPLVHDMPSCHVSLALREQAPALAQAFAQVAISVARRLND